MPIFPWPDDSAGAVSLTFDDGAPTHLSQVLPCLDEAGLRGTFYLNPGRRAHWPDQIEAWKQAAVTGHELGNHTTRHPCTCNYHFDDEYCLERLTLADLAETIDDAETQLDAIAPHQRGQRSFCYPCYQSDVGSGRERRSYIPLVAERFRAARGWGERPNDVRVVDLCYLSSWAVADTAGDEMVTYVEQAAAQGRWAILCFHGVGGDHIAIEMPAFQHLVDHLVDQRHRLWTAPLIEVADHVLRHRSPRP